MNSVLMLTVMSAPFVMGAPVPAETPQKVAPAEVVVQCYDDSSIRLTLLDADITLQTKYGDLKVPTVAVKKIDFANRTPPMTQATIDSAVKDLGHPDFATREKATQALKDLKDRAYPAAVGACKSADPEVARRAGEVVTHLKGKYGESNLVLRPFDVITTDDGSKLIGKIKGESLKVQTAQFGEQNLRLSDVKSLRLKGDEPVDVNAAPAPTNLNSAPYQNQFGKEFVFKLTAAMPQMGMGNAGIWGTDQYTLDSNLSVAAVHAGVLQSGQTGVVRIRIIASPPQFVAADRNGISSTMYGNYPAGAFEFIR